MKDLVDIVLLGQHYDLDADALIEAVEDVFESRSTHPIPSAFPDPPASWASPYKALAEPIGLVPNLSSAADSGRAIFAPVFLREQARLPVFHPHSHELIERRENLSINATQTMRVLGQSADGQRILGRSGGSLLSVSREAFARLPKLEQMVTVTHDNGRDIARVTDREIGLER